MVYVDNSKLKAVLEESPDYKVIAEGFSERVRNRKSINLYRLHRSLALKNPNIKREEVDSFFARLEALGIGKIKAHGPKGRLKEFNLSITMGQFVKNLLDKDLKKETRNRKKVDKKLDGYGGLFIPPGEPLSGRKMALRITKKGEIEIFDPMDLNDAEMVKIAKLAHILKSA